jgi:hypothetical protein
MLMLYGGISVDPSQLMWMLVMEQATVTVDELSDMMMALLSANPSMWDLLLWANPLSEHLAPAASRIL